MSSLIRHLTMSVFVALGLAAVPASAQDSGPASHRPAALDPDLIIVNAKVWTGVPNGPEAEALAIRGEKLAAVGANGVIRGLAGARTEIIDAGGRRVIPGITDSHTHFIEMGLQLSRINLRDARDRADFVERVAATAARMRPGQWMLGGAILGGQLGRPQSTAQVVDRRGNARHAGFRQSHGRSPGPGQLGGAEVRPDRPQWSARSTGR
jgi:hypothetical protein